MSNAALDHGGRHHDGNSAQAHAGAQHEVVPPEMEQPAAGSNAVGAILRARRIEVSWTVEQVAGALNLAPRQVEAIETGDYGALPGMAVSRGFIRSYAKLMRIDIEPHMSSVTGSAVVNAMPPTRRPLAAVPFSERQTGSLMGGHRHGSRLVLAGGVVLAVLVLGGAALALQRAGWIGSARDSLAQSGGKAMALLARKPLTTVAEDAASSRAGALDGTPAAPGLLASAGAPIAAAPPAAAGQAASAATMPGLTAGAGNLPTTTTTTTTTTPAPSASQGGAPALMASPMLNGNPASAAPSKTAAAAASAAIPAAKTTAAAASPAIPQIQPFAPAPAQALATQADEAVAQSPASSVGKLSSALDAASGGALALIMHEDSWVEIRRPDRSAIVSRMFKAGSAETFALDGPVLLIVGNAHGVDATLRGAPVELRAGNNNIARLNLK